MSDQSSCFIRAVECYQPRGPLSKSTFYRGVRAGDIPLEHQGPRSAVVPFRSVGELQKHLIERERARRAAAERPAREEKFLTEA